MGPRPAMPAEHGEKAGGVIEQASSVQVTMRTLRSSRSMPGGHRKASRSRARASGSPARRLAPRRGGHHAPRAARPPTSRTASRRWLAKTWLARRSAGASPSSMASASTRESRPAGPRRDPPPAGPPPARAAGHRGAPHRLGHAHVALLARQALAVFEQAQFLGGVDAGMAVGADAPGAVPGRQVEEAVAEVGLGGARPITAPRRAASSRSAVEMGGVHEAPARPPARDRATIARALAAPGEAVFDLLHLLGDVDVDGRAGVDRADAVEQILQCRRRHGAQQSAAPRRCARPARGLDDAQQAIDLVEETLLVFARRLGAEAARLIEHRQHRQADAARRAAATRRSDISAGLHRAGRPDRGARSGTRTPRYSRRAASRRRAAWRSLPARRA